MRFAGKYRVESARLAGWDYSRTGWYFVTICTRDRESFFGVVESEIVRLSAIGEIVAEEWIRTERQRPDVAVDEWVVMPNHIHGIILLGNDGGSESTGKPEAFGASGIDLAETRGTETRGTETRGTETRGTETFQRNVSTGEVGHRPPGGESETHGAHAGDGMKRRTPRLQPNSLGSIVGQFKGASTKRIWAAGFRDFAWQPRYYDHIIRGQQSLDRIRTYIRTNPVKWASDEYNLTARGRT